MDYCRITMAQLETEEFRVLFLDRKNVLITDEALGRGTVDHVPVYPREVAKRGLEVNASAVILVHNHPSGDPTPSGPDIQMTQEINNTLTTLGIKIHDHLIIGKFGEINFCVEGLIQGALARFFDPNLDPAVDPLAPFRIVTGNGEHLTKAYTAKFDAA